MKICVLASGSKGNCTFVKTKNHNLLLDIGISSLATEKKLREIDLDPSLIDMILITHTHDDHIGGLRVFFKKYHPQIIISKIMYNELRDIIDEDYVIYDDKIVIDNLTIESFKTSHDAADSRGYVITSDDKSLAYVTDTGYINSKNFKLLENKNLYIFESNHDVELLMNSRYPYQIKQRILGDYGHLSNKDSAYYLSKLIGCNTKKIILFHLSEQNNSDELAVNELNKALEKNNKSFKNIEVAHQNEKSEYVEI